MIYSDSDDSSVETMIQHVSLEKVLAFVVARDDVRRILPPPPALDVEPGDATTRPTLPAASGVRARLDADRTAKPLTAIVGVFPATDRRVVDGFADARAVLFVRTGVT